MFTLSRNFEQSDSNSEIWLDSASYPESATIDNPYTLVTLNYFPYHYEDVIQCNEPTNILLDNENTDIPTGNNFLGIRFFVAFTYYRQAYGYWNGDNFVYYRNPSLQQYTPQLGSAINFNGSINNHKTPLSTQGYIVPKKALTLSNNYPPNKVVDYIYNNSLKAPTGINYPLVKDELSMDSDTTSSLYRQCALNGWATFGASSMGANPLRPTLITGYDTASTYVLSFGVKDVAKEFIPINKYPDYPDNPKLFLPTLYQPYILQSGVFGTFMLYDENGEPISGGE